MFDVKKKNVLESRNIGCEAEPAILCNIIEGMEKAQVHLNIFYCNCVFERICSDKAGDTITSLQRL